MPVSYYWLPIVGLLVGCYGTMIGAGGGFLLVPLLLLLYPSEPAETITSIALGVVFFNALSGSIAYARQGRIHYRSGLVFALATVPGAILGALATRHIPRAVFDPVFGVLLVLMAAYLAWRPEPKGPPPAVEDSRGYTPASLTDRDGGRYEWRYNQRLGALLSVGVGFLSSVLGIGGGIIHVPALVNLLRYPVHVATATSHFILAIMALVGTLTHIVDGSFHGHGWRRLALLAVGVLLGAPLGAKLSDRLHGRVIIRGLAAGLLLVGLRLLLTG